MTAFAPAGSIVEHSTWVGILGKAAPLADYLLPYYAALTTLNVLGAKLVELVRIACAKTTECEACLRFRDPRVASSIRPDVLTLIEELDTTQGFTERERLAIRFAIAFGTNHHAIDDAMWGKLKSEFDDQEIMHSCIYVAHYVGMGRLGAAMRLIDSKCTLPGYRIAELLQVKTELA